MQRMGASFALVVLAACLLTTEAAAEVPDLEGTWGQKVVLTSVSEPPVVDSVTSQTITYLTYEIDQDGQKLEVESDTCHVQIVNGGDVVQTHLPSRFSQALADQTRSGRVIPAESGAKFTMGRSFSVVGAQLRVPASENLPTSPDDSRVVDADGDGHPGVTVKVRGMVSGDVYVVQRAWDEYRGTVESDDRITGRVDWHADQEVLGATSVFLKSRPPTRPHSNPAKSYFELVRLDSGTGCRKLLQQRQSVFGDS